jgi:tRNA(Ile)-lysidine synthetase-like protein
MLSFNRRLVQEAFEQELESRQSVGTTVGFPINLGFSCGVDSIVCSHLMKRLKYPIRLVHIDHKMIPEDKNIRQAAEKYAKDHGFDILVLDAVGKDAKTNLESVCRERRIEAFRKAKIEKIILCHHLSDCVENYLWNCFKGCSEHMPIRYSSDVGGVVFIRPFLPVSKSNIIKYAESNGLSSYVYEDPMNYQDNLLRSTIRHKIVPAIPYNMEKVVYKKFYNK